MEKTQEKQKKVTKQRLTKQEEKFTDKVLETGNVTQATQEAFNIKDTNYAGVKGHRLLRKDKIINAIEVKRESLKSALEKQGITPYKIAERVDVLLHAVDKEGKEDYTAIDKGLKHATNIYGVEDIEKPKGNTYNFILNQQFQEKVKPLEEAYKEQFRNVKPPEEI